MLLLDLRLEQSGGKDEIQGVLASHSLHKPDMSRLNLLLLHILHVYLPQVFEGNLVRKCRGDGVTATLYATESLGKIWARK